MGRQSSWMPILDAAYRLDRDDLSWLGGVTRAFESRLDSGLGVAGLIYDVSDPRRARYSSPQFFGCPNEVRESARRVLQALPEDIVHDSILSPAASTSSETLGRRRLSAWFRAAGSEFSDSAALNALDPSGHGCLLVAPMRRMASLTPRRRIVLERLSAHLASGHRLRRVLRVSKVALLDGAEAILDPAGRIAHAQGEARSQDAREALQRAVLRIDRVRTRKAPPPDDALAMWSALVEGRWSVIDHFDSDGRRFFLAMHNAAPVPLHRRLSQRERQIAAYAALGHSNKLIAYELGLNLSTIATHLATAMTKLGLRHRSDLIVLMRQLSAAQGSSRGGPKKN
jgi:DNA-binding CsgD family transcriptional regulator